MKAPRFAYARPASLAEALALLAEHKGEARVLAGGQSLVPMMNFRVAAPKVLVDINRIAALTGIKVSKNHLRIGALTRQAELERSADIARHLPLIAAAMPHVAHPAIRNRGTFGGSCALGRDPGIDMRCPELSAGFDPLRDESTDANARDDSSESALRSASQRRAEVSGMSRCVMPSGDSASTAALTTAGGMPMHPASPTPLAPSGLSGEGVHVFTIWTCGTSSARGIA